MARLLAMRPFAVPVRLLVDSGVELFVSGKCNESGEPRSIVIDEVNQVVRHAVTKDRLRDMTKPRPGLPRCLDACTKLWKLAVPEQSARELFPTIDVELGEPALEATLNDLQRYDGMRSTPLGGDGRHHDLSLIHI